MPSLLGVKINNGVHTIRQMANPTPRVCGLFHNSAKQQLYSHLSSVSKTIQVRRTRFAGHWWRSKDELISDILLSTPTYGCASVGQPVKPHLHLLSVDTGYSLEDLPGEEDDRDGWRERESQVNPCCQHDFMMMI